MTAFVVTIISDTVTMDPTIELMSLEIRKELDRIPEARLVVLDGDVAARKFKVSDGGFFSPGKPVVIKLRYEGKPDVQVFSGVIVRQSVEAGDNGTELKVELKDKAVAMTRQRRNLVLFDTTDEELYDKLARAAGLKVGTIDPAKIAHPQLVQYNATDWDFLLSRADVNGQVVLVDDGKLSVRAMSKAEAPKLRLEWGLDEIHALELELDGTGQYAAMSSHAWDPEQGEPNQADATPLRPTAGDTDPAALAAKLGDDSYDLVLPAAATEAELGPWATARLARSRLSLLRGRIVVAGRSDLKPFDRVELGGVGKRYNGKLLISAVTHKLDHDGWTTELQIGLPPDWFARKPDVADAPAGGLLPPATTLQVGQVESVEKDPKGEFRVRVKLPGLGAKDNVVWARMALPDAGKDRGFNFWPMDGDEVVVGFFAGDPRQAVILGSLYSKKTPAPIDVPAGDNNDLRAIISRAGTSVSFDDKVPSLTITTPGGHKIVLTEESGAEAITLTDLNGSKVTLDSKGITLKSASDLTIEASGKVVIKGSTVDIQ